MKLVALDLGTKMGVAIGDVRGVPTCATVVIGEAGAAHPSRFAFVMDWTHRLIRDEAPDLIAIEKPIAAGPKGGEERVMLAMGIRASIFGVAHMRGVRTREYAVSTVRKHFLGSGRVASALAKKRTFQMCRSLGWDVEDFEQSDAAAVWDLARGRAGFEASIGGMFNKG